MVKIIAMKRMIGTLNILIGYLVKIKIYQKKDANLGKTI